MEIAESTAADGQLGGIAFGDAPVILAARGVDGICQVVVAQVHFLSAGIVDLHELLLGTNRGDLGD